MVRKLSALLVCILVVASSLLVFPAPTVAGPDRTGQAIAFAHGAGAGGLFAFGGKGTASASAIRVGAGHYRITFNGNYLSASLNELVIQATAQSFNWGVANAVAFSASNTQVVVDVYTWMSNALVGVDFDYFVTVHLGR